MQGISIRQWNCMRHQFRNCFSGLHMHHRPRTLHPQWLYRQMLPKRMGSSVWWKEDWGSCHFNDEHKWALKTGVFREITAEYPELNIDLFATRLNHKFETYCSRKLDPESSFVDAFSKTCHSFHFYASPPFSLIQRCPQKINKDIAVIAPLWPSQPCFPFLLQHLYKQPWILNPAKNLAFLDIWAKRSKTWQIKHKNTYTHFCKNNHFTFFNNISKTFYNFSL